MIRSPLSRRDFLRNLAITGVGLLTRPGHLFGASQRGLNSTNSQLRARNSNAPVANFIDIARRVGLNAQTCIGGINTKSFIVESTGGGVAIFDYDNDGWLDIFIMNGWRFESFDQGSEPTNRLYRNNRDGTFADVTEAAGLIRHGWGQGVCVGDYDNDGNLDLFVTYYGHNVLYHNNGNGTFSDVTYSAGLMSPEKRYSTGAAFVDFDRDGHLDLFVAHYTDYDDATRHPRGQGQNCMWHGMPVFCGPRGLERATSSLYRNNGDGTFADVSDKSGIVHAGLHYGFTPLVLDYDNDGWPDVYVADDSDASVLLHNNHNGTFTELGLSAGVAYNGSGREQAGMGVSAADYDNDGWLDILKTNFADDTSTLYHNEHDGTFNDVTFPAGLGSNTQYLGWGTAFFDFDNDGWPDIFVANGHVFPEVDTATLDSTFKERKLLYLNNRDGTFDDVSLRGGPGILEKQASRGAAFGDLFNTGQLDIVINNMNDYPTLLHNVMPRLNHSITLHLIGTKSNRSAIGARVMVRAEDRQMIDEVRSGGSFCSQSDLRLHFGLGRSQKADLIEIRWPSGFQESLRNINGNSIVVIKEGAGVVKEIRFSKVIAW